VIEERLSKAAGNGRHVVILPPLRLWCANCATLCGHIGSQPSELMTAPSNHRGPGEAVARGHRALRAIGKPCAVSEELARCTTSKCQQQAFYARVAALRTRRQADLWRREESENLAHQPLSLISLENELRVCRTFENHQLFWVRCLFVLRADLG